MVELDSVMLAGAMSTFTPRRDHGDNQKTRVHSRSQGHAPQ